MDIYEQLKQAAGKLEYVAIVLEQKDLATWERKEYKTVFENTKQEMMRLEKTIEYYEITQKHHDLP